MSVIESVWLALAHLKRETPKVFNTLLLLFVFGLVVESKVLASATGGAMGLLAVAAFQRKRTRARMGFLWSGRRQD
jgi:uncharacterized membrane protein